MKRPLFNELMASMEEALDHSRGKRELRTTALPAPPQPLRAREIRALRNGLNASQAVFARYLNVSTQLVQAWEGDRRTPEGAALRLLEIGLRAPAVVFLGLVRPAPRPRTSDGAGPRAPTAQRRRRTR